MAIAIGLVRSEPAAGDAAEPPNLLLILTDDQSWSSLSCYGGRQVSTKHLDRLAESGLRLTSAYVMPQCTPTRAALMTGQHTAVNGMWHVIGWYGTPFAPVAEPMFRENLDPQDCRMPHLLRAAGYATGIAGKWHLTKNESGSYAGLNPSAGDDYGFDFVAPAGPGSQNEGDKWVNHLTDQAIEFIRDRRGQPWFFYLSHHTLHGKVSAPEELIAAYRQRGAPDQGLHNAVYLAAIEHLDRSVGRLMQAIEVLGEADNTLVVFLADNGGVDTSFQLPQWNGDPLDGSQPLRIREEAFDAAPLREGKGSMYEGGIRVPCLVRWPGVIAPGSVSDTPVHVVDWLPTFLSAASAPPQVTDGADLTPLFRGAAIPDRPLYWYLPLYDLRWAATPAAVIRKGPWKLIEFFGDHFDEHRVYRRGQRTELYHVLDDLAETRELSDRHPQLTAQLRGELLEWIRSTGRPVPSANPRHDPARALLETKQKQPWQLNAIWNAPATESLN